MKKDDIFADVVTKRIFIYSAILILIAISSLVGGNVAVKAYREKNGYYDVKPDVRANNHTESSDNNYAPENPNNEVYYDNENNQVSRVIEQVQYEPEPEPQPEPLKEFAQIDAVTLERIDNEFIDNFRSMTAKYGHSMLAEAMGDKGAIGSMFLNHDYFKPLYGEDDYTVSLNIDSISVTIDSWKPYATFVLTSKKDGGDTMINRIYAVRVYDAQYPMVMYDAYMYVTVKKIIVNPDGSIYLDSGDIKCNSHLDTQYVDVYNDTVNQYLSDYYVEEIYE